MAPVGLVYSRLRQVHLVLPHLHSGILMVHLAIKEGSKSAQELDGVRTRSRSMINLPNNPHLPARPAISDSSRSISLESTVSSSKSAPFCAATRAACTSVSWKADIRS